MASNKIFLIILSFSALLLAANPAFCRNAAGNGNIREWKKYYNEKAELYFSQGEYAKSAVIDEELLNLRLSKRELEAVLVRLARAQASNGENQKAIANYRKLIDATGGRPYVFYELAASYEAVDLYEEALSWYQAAVRRDRNFAQAYAGMGRVYWKIGLMNEALNQLNEAIRLGENSEEVYHILAHVYERQKNTAMAIQTQKAITAEYPTVDNYFRLGYLKFVANDFEKAVESFELSFKKDPENFEPPLYMGICFFRQGDLERSEYYLVKSSELLDENSIAHFFLALLYKQKGDVDQAAKCLKKAEHYSKSSELIGYINKTRKELESYSTR